MAEVLANQPLLQALFADRSLNLSDLDSVSSARTNLGLGTLATANVAPTATALATPRTINGVDFDGTANITLPSGLTQPQIMARSMGC